MRLERRSDEAAEGVCDRRSARAATKVRLALAVVAFAALAGALLVALNAVPTSTSTSRAPASRTWSFLDDVPSPRVLGFSVEDCGSGAWVLTSLDDASGARALANLAGLPESAPAIAILDDLAPRDVRLHTRCRASSERPQQACGLVFRQRDERTRYVAMVDAVSETVSLSVLVGDLERTIEQAHVPMHAPSWQELTVQARADHFIVSLNGKPVIETYDPTIADPGAVGLWAPSDCVAYFDELTVHALPTTIPHPSELLPFLL